MLPSRQAAPTKWILILLLGICSLHRGVGTEDFGDCTPLSCCEEDCCGPDTSWDTSIEYCIPDPGAPGFMGIFAPDFVPVCEMRVCCEDSCCGTGTYYEPSIQSCLPLTIPTAAPVAPTSPPTAAPNSSPVATTEPTQIIVMPARAPGFRPNVCGVSIEAAVALCRNTTTCDQAEIDEDCYEPCDFFNPSCPENEECFSFVSGCKDFPSFPNVPFDPNEFFP
jgi:hypothetical protein